MITVDEAAKLYIEQLLTREVTQIEVHKFLADEKLFGPLDPLELTKTINGELGDLTLRFTDYS